MRKPPLFLATCLILCAALGAPRTGGTSPPPSRAPAAADGAPRAAAPRVALLATVPGALHTSLYHADAATGEVSAPLATFTHLPGAVVRGAALPGTAIVIASADTAETRDLSFAASLFRVAPHTPPELLCDGVVHASRPLVTRGGRVFVSRGAAGPAPGAGATGPFEPLRVDALSIDEVDPWTGALRTVHTMSGHVAFLAGALGDELIVYRVFPEGADIVGVDPDTGAVRPIVPRLPPFARDFSVDARGGALVYRGRHEADPRTWTIERVDLATGRTTRLLASPDMNLIPHAWPGGEVAYNPPDHSGLTLLGGAPVSRAPALSTAAGQPPPGQPSSGQPSSAGAPRAADWILALDEDGQWAAGLHTVQGALPVPFALDIPSGRSVPLRAPGGARVDVAGLVSAAGGEP